MKNLHNLCFSQVALIIGIGFVGKCILAHNVCQNINRHAFRRKKINREILRLIAILSSKRTKDRTNNMTTKHHTDQPTMMKKTVPGNRFKKVIERGYKRLQRLKKVTSG